MHCLMNISHGACLYLALLIILEQQSADCNVCINSLPIPDHALSGHVRKTVNKQTLEHCIFSCELDPNCFSINFHPAKNLCEFNLGTVEAFGADLVRRRGAVYIRMVVRSFDACVIATPCRNRGRCKPYPTVHCVCPERFSGSLCEG